MKKLLFIPLFIPLLAGAQTNTDSLKYISSIKYYTKAIAEQPNNADYYHKRGAAYLDLGNFNDALDDLNKSIFIDIKTEQTFFDRGRTYYALKNYDKAIIDYTKAIALKKGNTDALYNRGLAKRQKEDYKGALLDYNQAILLNPKDPDAFIERGICKKTP